MRLRAQNDKLYEFALDSSHGGGRRRREEYAIYGHGSAHMWTVESRRRMEGRERTRARTPFKLWFHLKHPHIIDIDIDSERRPENRMNSNYTYYMVYAMLCYVSLTFCVCVCAYVCVCVCVGFFFYGSFFCCLFIQLCSLNRHLKWAQAKKGYCRVARTKALRGRGREREGGSFGGGCCINFLILI